jgi:hypothetical protein
MERARLEIVHFKAGVRDQQAYGTTDLDYIVDCRS